jgi:hypothetical protein
MFNVQSDQPCLVQRTIQESSRHARPTDNLPGEPETPLDYHRRGLGRVQEQRRHRAELLTQREESVHCDRNLG